MNCTSPSRGGLEGPHVPYPRPNTFLADARREQAEAAARNRPARVVVSMPSRGHVADMGDHHSYALAALRDECEKVRTAACRNDTLNIAAFNLRSLINAGAIDEATVMDALLDAGRAADTRPTDPFTDEEMRGTIRSGFAGADAKVGARQIPDRPSTDALGLEFDSRATSAATDDAAPSWEFVDGASFILDIPSETPANWGDGHDVLWAQGESLMIAGPMGLGKTTLGLLLLHARLGLGDGTLLGYPVAPCEGNILYLAMDRPAQIARAALRMFTEDERDILRDRVKFWKGPPPFDVAKHPGILTALAEAADAADVYLDSVKDAAIGLSEDEVGAGYNRARQKLLASDRQLVEMHHTTKRGQGGGPPTAVADIYGSAWIANGTGSIILLAGDPGDPIVNMRHVRAPADEVGPFQLLHDQAAGAMTVHHNTDLVALVAHSGPNGLTARDAAAALFSTDKPTPAQKEKARRKLVALATEGHLTAREGTKGGTGGGTSTAWFPASRRAS